LNIPTNNAESHTFNYPAAFETLRVDMRNGEHPDENPEKQDGQIGSLGLWPKHTRELCELTAQHVAVRDESVEESPQNAATTAERIPR
jgi:hypothetical protein